MAKSNTLLIGMFAIMILGAGAAVYWFFIRKKPIEPLPTSLSSLFPPGYSPITTTTGPYPSSSPSSAQYYATLSDELLEQQQQQQQNSYLKQLRIEAGYEEGETPWWAFWSGWNKDQARTTDVNYEYYWDAYSQQLRYLGLSDYDINDFIIWITHRNRSEREIRDWITERATGG